MPILPKKVLLSRRNTLFSKPGIQEPCIFLSKLFWLFVIKSYHLLGQINLNQVWIWLQQRLCLWSCDGCRPAQHIPAQGAFALLSVHSDPWISLWGRKLIVQLVILPVSFHTLLQKTSFSPYAQLQNEMKQANICTYLCDQTHPILFFSPC